MGSDDVAVITVWWNNYRINFWYMTKSEAVHRMKSADLSKKNKQLWLWKQLFITVMLNNMPESMTKQQTDCERKTKKGA